jgi:hypothetical protein
MEARWYVRLSLLSFLSITLMGLLMRAKVVFEMPWVVQKHLQLGHAFFALNGWVSFSLLWLIWVMFRKKFACQSKLMPWLLGGQYMLSWVLFAVYLRHGMGYWSFLVEELMFAWMILTAAHYIYLLFTLTSSRILRHWLFPALMFNVLAGAGLMYLAWHFMHRSLSMQQYLTGFYSYLHYQYNGWFLFGAMALTTADWTTHKRSGGYAWIKALAFLTMAGILLSLLWHPMPLWLYVFAIGVAIAQLLVWLRWIQLNQELLITESKKLGQPINWLLKLAGAAIVARMIFQILSTVPALEKIAFSFRPIVIAYLHLILLGVFSSFLLYWLIRQGWLPNNRLVKICIWLFLSAFLSTESLLALQGMASMSYSQIPLANELLLVFTALFPLSAAGLCWAAWLHKPLHRGAGLTPELA